jgi:hypothetical protein
MQLVVTEAALEEIAREGYDPIYGARPLKRVIQQRIQNPLAGEILKGQFGEGATIRIDFRDDEFVFSRADSEAEEPAEARYRFSRRRVRLQPRGQRSGRTGGSTLAKQGIKAFRMSLAFCQYRTSAGIALAKPTSPWYPSRPVVPNPTTGPID